MRRRGDGVQRIGSRMAKKESQSEGTMTRVRCCKMSPSNGQKWELTSATLFESSWQSHLQLERWMEEVEMSGEMV